MFKRSHLDSIIFLAASAYLESCFLASPVNFGLTNLMGMSFMISLYIDIDISGKQLLGNNGSLPVSITFLSISHRLKESFGASIARKKLNVKLLFAYLCTHKNMK